MKGADQHQETTEISLKRAVRMGSSFRRICPRNLGHETLHVKRGVGNENH
jgi:hypothetical protein